MDYYFFSSFAVEVVGLVGWGGGGVVSPQEKWTNRKISVGSGLVSAEGCSVPALCSFSVLHKSPKTRHCKRQDGRLS